MQITENNYPVQRAYFTKLWTIFLILLLVAGGLAILGMQPGAQKLFSCATATTRQCEPIAITLYVFAGFAVFIAILIILQIISTKTNFHYAFDDEMITLQQGLFGHEEKRMSYQDVKKVSVSQGTLDRYFGIAVLTIENALSQAAESSLDDPTKRQKTQFMKAVEKNSITLYGLSRLDAENLKTIILQKMQESA
jgi:uncharacterized membrane protein YdbT with pleckstrin-like domain